MAQSHWDHGYACGREDGQAGRNPDARPSGDDFRAGYTQGYQDHRPQVILVRRSKAERVRDLSAKLREGLMHPDSVALALDVLAEELAEEE